MDHGPSYQILQAVEQELCCVHGLLVVEARTKNLI